MNSSTVRRHEADFQHLDEYKHLIDSPKYIYAINGNKAQELSAKKPIENRVSLGFQYTMNRTISQ